MGTDAYAALRDLAGHRGVMLSVIVACLPQLCQCQGLEPGADLLLLQGSAASASRRRPMKSSIMDTQAHFCIRHCLMQAVRKSFTHE